MDQPIVFRDACKRFLSASFIYYRIEPFHWQTHWFTQSNFLILILILYKGTSQELS